MKKTPIIHLLLLGLGSVLLAFFSIPGKSDQHVKKDPFTVSHFKSSKENTGLYGDYRKKWTRLTGFELSSLHWNQFVAVFINQSPEIYRNNHIEYLRTSQDDYDEDEDEDEDEEGSAAVSRFKHYPVGTMVAKEGFTSNEGKPGSPTFLVIMKKREKGYDPSHGDWEYMQFAPDGTTMIRGKGSDPAVSKLCSSCHINVADRGYIFSSFFSGSVP